MSESHNVHKCTSCAKIFETITECLNHEVTTHIVKTKHQSRKRKQRHKISNMNKSLCTDKKIAQRANLKAILRRCERGDELEAILNFYCIDGNTDKIIVESLFKTLHQELGCQGNVEIKCFGSICTGLALKDSDVDLYITYHDLSSHYLKDFFNYIVKILTNSQEFRNIIPIRNARVPIIKCLHLCTGFNVDINVSCASSVCNTKFIRSVLLLDKRIHQLFHFLKIWAKNLAVVDRKCMTSYCLITLVLFYLQQPQRDFPAVIPSMEIMQKDLDSNIVEGINYAFDLTHHYKPLPAQITVLNLIKGFFEFYLNFNFKYLLIAPYLGKAIPKAKLQTGEYNYVAFKEQMHLLKSLKFNRMRYLQTNSAMCVQDIFALNHNVAQSVSGLYLNYFRQCIHYSIKICADTNLTDGEIYAALLLDIITKFMDDYVDIDYNEVDNPQYSYFKETNPGNGNSADSNVDSQVNSVGLSNTKFLRDGCKINSTTDDNPKEPNIILVSNSFGSVISCNKSDELLYSFTPSRTETHWLVKRAIELKNNQKLECLWANDYIDAIHKIITHLYLLDVQSILPIYRDKQPKLDADNNIYITKEWSLKGNVDMWTSRDHQRHSFWEYQLQQTKKFLMERQQDPAYATQLNCILKIRAYRCNIRMDLTLRPKSPDTILLKKDTNSKFFNRLKMMLQNYNLKETIPNLS